MPRLLFALSAAFLAVPAISSPAQVTYLGTPGFSGCAPAGGIAPTLTISSNAVQLGLTFDPAYWTPYGTGLALLFVGNCASAPYGAVPTPPACPPSPSGCFLYFDSTGPVMVFALFPGALFFSMQFLIPIPADPALVGLQFCAQGFSTTGPGFTGCIAASNGLSITILP